MPLKTPGKRVWRAWVLVVATAVIALALLGRIVWRLRSRPAAIPPAVGGIPLSPEEVSLQRQAELKPRDPSPWRTLGDFYMPRQPFEAMWAFQEALERAPGDPGALLRLSEALEAAGLYRPALEPAADALRRAPDNRDARLHLARLYRQLGEAKPAVAVLQNAGKRLATWPEGLLELGLARQLDGDLVGAVDALRRHLEVSANSEEGAIRLARALLEKGDAEAARRVLQHGRMSAQRDPRFPFYLGLSWLQDGQSQKPAEAMDYFKEALAIAPDHPLPHHYLGQLLARQGHWREAQAHFLKAIQADPTYPDPQLWYARSLGKTGDAVQAKEQLGAYYFRMDDSLQAAQAFEAMEKVSPENSRAPRLVSLAYIRLGRKDWAIRETREALQRHANDTALLERLATLYVMNHSRPLARRTCAQWLQVQPGAAGAHWLLGRAAQDDLKLPEAIREHETAVAAEPDNPEYAAALAAALSDAGGKANLRRAADLLQRVLQREPRNAGYHRDLGIALQQWGDPEGARRQFLAALDLDSHDGAAYTGISQLCVRLHQPSLARFFAPLVRAEQDRFREEQQLSRQLSQNPTRAEAHYALAEFLMRTASFPTAQYHLERALALRPDYPEARAALARAKRVISVR